MLVCKKQEGFSMSVVFDAWKDRECMGVLVRGSGLRTARRASMPSEMVALSSVAQASRRAAMARTSGPQHSANMSRCSTGRKRDGLGAWPRCVSVR